MQQWLVPRRAPWSSAPMPQRQGRQRHLVPARLRRRLQQRLQQTHHQSRWTKGKSCSRPVQHLRRASRHLHSLLLAVAEVTSRTCKGTQFLTLLCMALHGPCGAPRTMGKPCLARKGRERELLSAAVCIGAEGRCGSSICCARPMAPGATLTLCCCCWQASKTAAPVQTVGHRSCP